MKKYAELIKMTKVLQGFFIQCMNSGVIDPLAFDAIYAILEDTDKVLENLNETLSPEDYQAFALMYLAQRLEKDETSDAATKKAAKNIQARLVNQMFNEVSIIPLDDKWQA